MKLLQYRLIRCRLLYDGIYSYKQENQTNSKTLRSIINASKEISESFYKAIGLERLTIKCQ